MDTINFLCTALAMTTHYVWLVPLLPLLAALLIALPMLFGRATGDEQEPDIAGLASAAALGALLLLLAFDLAVFGAGGSVTTTLADWMRVEKVPLRLSFILDRTSLPFATLIALIGWIVLRFSASYLHREVGFRRFFAVMSFFLSGMLLIVLSGNLVLTFVGWEIVGLSSWLLIGYAWERPQASGNALFVFMTQRIGDAAFLLGIGLAIWSTHSTEWSALADGGALPTGTTGTARLLALGFVVAALAKSAQLPFSPWIARALEGPTPSSAIFYGSLMLHAGVYLLLRLEPLLVQIPDVLALIAVIGLVTALYAHLCALVQSDVKSALVFASLTQVGLMFFACGLGWFELATWHLCLHAAWRAYQFLLAPAYLQLVRQPARPVPRWLAAHHRLYTAAVHGFWIESLAHNLLTRPTLALGRDMRALDERVIDPLVGVPRADEHGAQDDANDAIRAHGVAERILLGLANYLQRLETRLLLSGDGALQQALRRAGAYMETLEVLLEQPRYLMLMVMATFVVIL